jgi:molecular chaperone DnaK
LEKPERGIDPMECVAMGAAIQGAVISGEITDIVLLDVTPLSLGVETLGGVFTKIIERNTTVPTKQSQTFTTAADFQTAVTIHVLQGERTMAKDDISLGQFDLTGIPPAPRGIPQVDVTFDINADGVLNVSAKDLATGKQMGIKIAASTKLGQTEKNRMIREAEQFNEQDKRAKEEAEIRNTADSVIYTSEKTLREIGDKLTQEQKAKLEEAIQSLKGSLSTGGLAEISSKVEELRSAVQEAATIYEQAASQRAQEKASQEAPPPPEEEQQQGKKTVEAEYRVVDEDKSISLLLLVLICYDDLVW